MPAVVREWSRRLKSKRDFYTARPGMHEPHARKSRAAPVGDDKIYLVGERKQKIDRRKSSTGRGLVGEAGGRQGGFPHEKAACWGHPRGKL